jgi:hypothetical protein
MPSSFQHEKHEKRVQNNGNRNDEDYIARPPDRFFGAVAHAHFPSMFRIAGQSG